MGFRIVWSMVATTEQVNNGKPY